MLQLFNRDGVQLAHARVKVLVFFQAERGRSGLALQVRMVDKHSRKIGFDLVQPIRRRFRTQH